MFATVSSSCRDIIGCFRHCFFRLEGETEEGVPLVSGIEDGEDNVEEEGDAVEVEGDRGGGELFLNEDRFCIDTSSLCVVVAEVEAASVAIPSLLLVLSLVVSLVDGEAVVVVVVVVAVAILSLTTSGPMFNSISNSTACEAMSLE